ncbi:hypothetical protein AAG906_015598 [Vitis piasezkii]
MKKLYNSLHQESLNLGPPEYDGACLQMRMSYSPATHLFLFLVQWTNYHLAGIYVDGMMTMSTHERKASIREFYGNLFYNLSSLLQLQRGFTNTKDKKQKAVCMEREEECGICMEMNSKIVLPNCNHAMYLICYQECPKGCNEDVRRQNSVAAKHLKHLTKLTIQIMIYMFSLLTSKVPYLQIL